MSQECFSLDGLNGYEFEELIAKIMKKKGYCNIKVTRKSGDLGKDIIMEDLEGNIFIVECKHNKFVGRPIIQKLQGAMSHEKSIKSDRKVQGIIVTSGSFSKEALNYNKELKQKIELIDGKKLKNLCKELGIIVLNGKVQILANNSFINIPNEDSIKIALKGYSKIYGSKHHTPRINSKLVFEPVCFFQYKIAFSTSTSIGCIDNYSNQGNIIINGKTGHILNKNLIDFFYNKNVDLEQINPKDKFKKGSFEFTENDAEDLAIHQIIKDHSHVVRYTGNNNVTYNKNCIPKKRDIDISKFLPMYLPNWSNDINILKQHYNQNFYVKGKLTYPMNDDFKKCKICESKETGYEKVSICVECARIVCKDHIKIDFWDKKTPICTKHEKPFKLWLQKRYFALEGTKEKYRKSWNQKNFFQKIYEDQIVFGLSITGAIIILIIIFIWLSKFV